MHFIEFTIQDITVGGRAFMYLEEYFPPPISVMYPVTNVVLETELISLIHNPHYIVVLIY